MINLPIEIGDLVLGGRFKNKKIIVKEIGYDQYGLPTVNGRGILKIRIPKLYQKQEKKEMKEDLKRLIKKVIKEESEKASWNAVYDFVLSNLKGRGAFANSGEMERAVKKKFGWDDDIEDAAWQAWQDYESE